MNHTIQVLNIQIDNRKNNIIMKKVQSYFKSETLNTIEVVSMDTLMMAVEQENLREAIEQCDLVIPGDKEILEAADVTAESERSEVADGSFWNDFIRVIEKKKTKVFVLAASDEELQVMSSFVRKNYRGVRIMGAGILNGETSSESVVNKINAAGVECVLGFLPTPMRELFVMDHRAWINAKLWLGIDGSVVAREMHPRQPFRDFFMRLLFRRKVGREKKENIEN